MNELALFAGAGGGILGGKLLGWRTVCAVEINADARNVLLARQDDGCLEPFPVWDDVRTFNGLPWRGLVDVVSGGFPCQDISIAGGGDGLDGERSGLWREMARIVGEVRPRFVLVENSPALTFRGLGVCLGDLAGMGYNAAWGVLGACHAGGPHRRERIWILAYTDTRRLLALQKPSERILTRSQLWESFGTTYHDERLASLGAVRGKDDVLAGDLDRLAMLGNGQVPAVVRAAWSFLRPEQTHDVNTRHNNVSATPVR